MIARPETLGVDPVAAVLADAAREAADALYVVFTDDDADCLTLCGYEAVVAARGEQVRELAVAAADKGRRVQFVGDVGAAVRDDVTRVAPHARVVHQREPRSPALALGIVRSLREPSEAELRAARNTWLALAAEAREDTAPTTERTDDAADYVPPPVNVLPPVMGQFVQQGSAAQGVDPAFYMVPMLGVLAGSIGSTRRVVVKGTWLEPALLWTANVAPSGSGKSPPLKEAARPVTLRNQELHERSAALREVYEAEREARRGDRESNRPPPKEPPVLRAIVKDATLEALCSRLNDNPRGLLLCCDELAQWLGSFDRYRSGGDRAQWLSLHDGDGLQVDRRGGGSLLVRSACVSVVGSIQVGTARRLVASEQNLASGLAARLLLAMPPVTAPRWTDAVIGEDVLADYHRVVNGLLDLEHDVEGEAVLMSLSDEASDLFAAHFNDNSIDWKATHDAGDEDVASALAKLRGGAARLALVLCLARHAEDGTAAMARTIEAVDMRAGIALARWFAGEARRLYGRWRNDEAQAVAGRERGALSELAERLAGILGARAHTLDELHAATGRCIPGERMRAALALLAGNGRARCERIPGKRGGRAREVWALVPTTEGAQ
jgi:hypothetical protein